MHRTRHVLGGMVLVIAALTGPLVGARPASACSCVPLTATDAVATSDAVVVGRVVDRAEHETGLGTEEVWTVEVDEVIAGAVPPVVEVRAGPGSCAIGDAPPAMVLGAAPDGRYHLWVCGEPLTASELLAAAQPLPPPAPGPAEALVAVEWGAVHVLALDARGAVVGYGAGHSVPALVAACPGGRHSVEVPAAPTTRVVVRDLSTLDVVVPDEGPTAGGSTSVPVDLACRDAEAAIVDVLVRDDGTAPASWRVVRRTPGGEQVVSLGTADAAALHPAAGRAVVVTDGVVTVWDLETATAEELARLDDGATVVGLAVDHDGALAVARGGVDRWYLTVDDVVLLGGAGASLATVAVGPDRWLEGVRWLGDGTVAVLARGSAEDSPGAPGEVVRIDRGGGTTRTALPGRATSVVATSTGLLAAAADGIVHVAGAGTTTAVGPAGEATWSLAPLVPPVALDAPPPAPRPATLLQSSAAPTSDRGVPGISADEGARAVEMPRTDVEGGAPRARRWRVGAVAAAGAALVLLEVTRRTRWRRRS